MSGHSKWSTIKHAKGIADAKRGALFTKFIKEISIAAKMGGGDPDSNPRLRTAMLKAKAASMPKDNIERAIKKGTGELGAVSYEELVYEGYAPGGVAVLVDVLTDNKNRTAANVRSAFTKGSGSVGTPGCVSYMFDEKGQIIIDKEECDMDADELMMIALDGGAEDFNEEEDSFEIITSKDDFSQVRTALEDANITMASAEVTKLPQNYVSLTDPDAVKCLQRTLDLLDEDDDVQAVYTNWEEEE